MLKVVRCDHLILTVFRFFLLKHDEMTNRVVFRRSGSDRIRIRRSENPDSHPKIAIFGTKIGSGPGVPGGVLISTRKCDLRSRTVEGHFLRAFKGDLHAIFKNLQNFGQNGHFWRFLAIFGGPDSGVQKSGFGVRKSGKIRKNPEKSGKNPENRPKKIRKITI